MTFLVTGVATVLALWLAIVARRRAAAPQASALFALAGILGGVTLLHCLTIVPAGHVGIVDLFGRVSPAALQSGLHLRNPLARVVPLSVKTQEIKEALDAPSQEGLTLQVEASVLFHLDPEKAPDVYRTVGPDYVKVILEPQFRSVARGVTASYDARALYTSEREALATQIAAELKKRVEPRGIAVEATPLRKLTLPARLAAAIEEKLGAEQESQRMQFVLQKEKQEAERKRLEALGIADFQRIVTQGISPELLRWKGIEATMKLAESGNAKVVVVGGGKDGLPLILGGQ